MAAIKRFVSIGLLVPAWLSSSVLGAVLPEERADLMYHRYDGGGVTIDGPSLLVRKNFAEKVSVSANYYVDSVSSASIDVTASGASRYTEERKEYSLSADYLYEKSLMSVGFTNSTENDYEAETVFIGVSQDFFGDLTTISFGYAQGNDTVKQNGVDDFEASIRRENYRFSISQILTPSLIASFSYESISDEGFLNNPYRSYRFLINPLDPSAGYRSEQEVYPQTRTSDAAALRAIYYLPYRAAVRGEYRYFTDDWGIKAHTYEVQYTHTLGTRWIFDVKYRAYSQDQADFYSDLFFFAAQDPKDYRARDKELSQFSSQTVGLGISYELGFARTVFDRSTISLQWDHLEFDYDNFRDLTDLTPIAGDESLYSFDADVYRLFLSIWY